jgi:hypothetical protein
MNQQFSIDQLKIVYDGEFYNVFNTIPDDEGNEQETLMASFRSPTEAIRYFAEYVAIFEQQKLQMGMQ